MLQQTPVARPSRPGLGLAAIGFAAALWALGAAVAADLFEAGVAPLELAAARAVVATLGLACVPAAWRSSGSGRGGLRPVVALGLCIALVNAAYYVAIDHLRVAVAIVLQYTAPAMVVVWLALVARRRPSGALLAGLALALVGVVAVSGVLGSPLDSLDALGLLAGLASGVLFASYTLIGERVGAAYGPLAGLLRAFAVASLAWIAWQATRGWPGELFEPSNLPGVAYVGLAATLAPFLLYVWGIEHVRAERAAIAATLEPVLAGLVAWAWLGQSLGVGQIVGGALVMGAVVVIQATHRAPVIAAEV